jgi:hypothetical protein
VNVANGFDEVLEEFLYLQLREFVLLSEIVFKCHVRKVFHHHERSPGELVDEQFIRLDDGFMA